MAAADSYNLRLAIKLDTVDQISTKEPRAKMNL